MSNADWSEIYREDPEIASTGSPIKANRHMFDSAATFAHSTADAADEASTQVASLTYLDAGAFEGDAAQNLIEHMEKVGVAVQAVGPVFRELATAFDRHLDELDRLRRHAATALARARTAWHARTVAADEQAAAAKNIATIDAELGKTASLLESWQREIEARQHDDSGEVIAYSHRIGKAQSEVEKLQRQRAAAKAAHERATTQRVRQEEVLADIRDGPGHRRSWYSLRSAEEHLNNRTAGRIDAIDLDGLADPSWFEQAVRSTVSSNPLWWQHAFLFGLLRGDHTHARLAVREWVDKTAKWLTWAGVALVVAAPFTGPFAPLTLAVAALSFGVAGVLKGIVQIDKSLDAGAFGIRNDRWDDMPADERKNFVTDTGEFVVSSLVPGGPKVKAAFTMVTTGVQWLLRRGDEVTDVNFDLDVPVQDETIRSPEASIGRARSLVRRGAPSVLGPVTPRFCVVVGARS